MTTRTTRPNRLDTEPLTANQLGAIHLEFIRLGFDTEEDRGERLWLTGELARSGPIGSTKELSMGEAGRVVNALGRCRTPGELYELAGGEPPGLIARIRSMIFG